MPTLVTSGSPTFNAGPPTSCTIDSTGADRVQAPVSGLNTTASWWAARVEMLYASSVVQSLGLFDWRDDGSNYVRFGWSGAASGQGWLSGRRLGGSGGDGAWVSDTFAANAKRTVIMRWDTAGWAQSIAGAAFNSFATTQIPVLAATQMDIGSYAGANQIGCNVIWAAWGNGVPTDADATTINGFGDTDHLPDEFPASCLAVWPAVDATYSVPGRPPFQKLNPVPFMNPGRI